MLLSFSSAHNNTNNNNINNNNNNNTWKRCLTISVVKHKICIW